MGQCEIFPRVLISQREVFKSSIVIKDTITLVYLCDNDSADRENNLIIAFYLKRFIRLRTFNLNFKFILHIILFEINVIITYFLNAYFKDLRSHNYKADNYYCHVYFCWTFLLNIYCMKTYHNIYI